MPRRCPPFSLARHGFLQRNDSQALTLAFRALHWTKPAHRALLLAPATPSFSSTHASRDWDPITHRGASNVLAEEAQRTATANGSSGHAENEYENDAGDDDASRSSSSSPSRTAKDSVVMSHPYSVRAYRARLQHGNFDSLRELTRAAYAPGPLQVLVDLLRVSSSATQAEQPHMSTSALRGVRHALARAVDVQWVMSAAVEEARDAVAAAETLGDAASHAAVQDLMNQLGILTNAVDVCARGEAARLPQLPSLTLAAHENEDDFASSSVTVNAVQPDWLLPTATHATLLRGVLQLAALTGAHLHALGALDELILLDERQQRARDRERATTRGTELNAGEDKGEKEDDDDDDSFSMDDALALVDAAAQRHVAPLTAQDHLYAMQACATEHHRDFRTTLSLYNRFVQHVAAGRFPATAADFTSALVALAHSSRTTVEFTELRTLLVASEAAATVPVSVPLYTALIDAASRAVEEPQRMSIALSLYRRLRDGALTPTADTYAALIACCASTREPTHAFAFYHEARQVCGVAHFTPRVYTNLLLSYTAAGYGADARKTLDVLVEAGAPLSRASFHAALASAVTVREAQEIVAVMTDTYHITPTPHTYAFVVQALARTPAGVQTALQLFDVHEEALRAAARLSAAASSTGDDDGRGHSVGSEGKTAAAVSTTAEGVALEPLLLQQYPLYVRALEDALMRLRVDLTQDPRLKGYLMPLLRVAQQRMNAFTGMAPQAPIRVPDKERLCIAVLAADVLANVDEWVLPFMAHYSVLVVPYSSLLSLQKGGGRRVDGVMPQGAAAGLYDPVWQATSGGGEHDAIVEHRRRRLQRFLDEHKDVVHLVSLEEELRWSRETRRYGVGITDLFARAAAVALHLARRTDGPHARREAADELDRGSVYAQHPDASIVLVSSDYARCGKYVVALKQARGAQVSAGLRAALRRVSYHNPVTNPNWVPPSLSISRQQREKKAQNTTSEENTAEKRSDRAAAAAAAAGASVVEDLDEGAQLDSAAHEKNASAALDADAAYLMYRQLLQADVNEKKEGEKESESTARTAAAAKAEEDEMDAALLMSLLNDDDDEAPSAN